MFAVPRVFAVGGGIVLVGVLLLAGPGGAGEPVRDREVPDLDRRLPAVLDLDTSELGLAPRLGVPASPAALVALREVPASPVRPRRFAGRTAFVPCGAPKATNSSGTLPRSSGSCDADAAGVEAAGAAGAGEVGAANVERAKHGTVCPSILSAADCGKPIIVDLFES